MTMGLTREGVTIMSQDERVDAKNIGEVVAYGGDLISPSTRALAQARWLTCRLGRSS